MGKQATNTNKVRPLTAYNFFQKHVAQNVSKDERSDFPRFSRNCSAQWREMDLEEKRPFEEKAAEAAKHTHTGKCRHYCHKLARHQQKRKKKRGKTTATRNYYNRTVYKQYNVEYYALSTPTEKPPASPGCPRPRTRSRPSRSSSNAYEYDSTRSSSRGQTPSPARPSPTPSEDDEHEEKVPVLKLVLRKSMQRQSADERKNKTWDHWHQDTDSERYNSAPEQNSEQSAFETDSKRRRTPTTSHRSQGGESRTRIRFSPANRQPREEPDTSESFPPCRRLSERDPSFQEHRHTPSRKPLFSRHRQSGPSGTGPSDTSESFPPYSRPIGSRLPGRNPSLQEHRHTPSRMPLFQSRHRQSIPSGRPHRSPARRSSRMPDVPGRADNRRYQQYKADLFQRRLGPRNERIIRRRHESRSIRSNDERNCRASSRSLYAAGDHCNVRRNNGDGPVGDRSTRQMPRYPSGCAKCGEPFHSTNICRHREKVQCRLCRRYGHKDKFCSTFVFLAKN